MIPTANTLFFFLVIIQITGKNYINSKTFFCFIFWSLPKTPAIDVCGGPFLRAFKPMRPPLKKFGHPCKKLFAKITAEYTYSKGRKT